MAFRYCRKCEYGFSEGPTAREDIGYSFSREEGQECPRCGTRQPRWQSNEEWIVDLDDRLREIEKKNPA